MSANFLQVPPPTGEQASNLIAHFDSSMDPLTDNRAGSDELVQEYGGGYQSGNMPRISGHFDPRLRETVLLKEIGGIYPGILPIVVAVLALTIIFTNLLFPQVAKTTRTISVSMGAFRRGLFTLFTTEETWAREEIKEGVLWLLWLKLLLAPARNSKNSISERTLFFLTFLIFPRFAPS